ncbi:hypothetical protein RFI_05918 [Reticulomyxa filosa]|uniref:CBS domain-containing protein n=1 Tax=Reticulomyxa filosa TaxID=46433 RepID=X6NZD8_RETFI|nr:hypothetical protein RFI_05918 [Reticulomyxa filosa]|eukprot:ETO31204.1 hypothetical protein RFI_05918 [Reticulomyxa filosa]
MEREASRKDEVKQEIIEMETDKKSKFGSTIANDFAGIGVPGKEENQGGKFIGLITRQHIYVMLAMKKYGKIHELSRLRLLKQRYLNDEHFKTIDLQDIINKDEALRNIQRKDQLLIDRTTGLKYESFKNPFYMDFSPYIHLSPFTVKENTPVLRCYQLFRQMGLRHLCVLNDFNEVAGIITSHNLTEFYLKDITDKIKDDIQKTNRCLSKIEWLYLKNTVTPNTFSIVYHSN